MKGNGRRQALLSAVYAALAGGMSSVYDVMKAQFANRDYMDSSRGKGRSKGFSKSVAMAKDNTTFFPMSKRNGKKECARRIAQGFA